MNISELTNKKILIVGRGAEGTASAEFLKKAVPTATVTIVDKEDGNEYLAHQSEYDLAIRSPGVHPSLITIPYTTATNIFFANTKGKVIGVTGTKGKSTTASLIFSTLKEAKYAVKLVGNIGTPALTELLEEKGDQWYVYELSSYQLQDIEYSPHISVIVNLYPEHMDYHGSVESYWEAKKRIVTHATVDDFLVYNAAFPDLVRLAKESKAKSLPYVGNIPFPQETVPLLGAHNLDNVRAAVTVAELLAIPTEVMEQAVRAFKPLPHRLENVGTFAGITFYDDAISTTPESAMAAIDAVGAVGTIFLGGQDRGYDFTQLIALIAQKHIPNVVLFPDSGETIGALLRALPNPPQLFSTRSMGDAVAFAYKATTSGTACLLSCASPSYSLWKNFTEKGDQFQKEVRDQGAQRRP